MRCPFYCYAYEKVPVDYFWVQTVKKKAVVGNSGKHSVDSGGEYDYTKGSRSDACGV